MLGVFEDERPRMGCGNGRHPRGERQMEKGCDRDLEEGHRIGVLVGWEPSCPSRKVDREEPDQTLKVRVDSRETDILKEDEPEHIYRVDQGKEVWGREDGYRFLNPGTIGLSNDSSSEISQEGLNPRCT